MLPLAARAPGSKKPNAAWVEMTWTVQPRSIASFTNVVIGDHNRPGLRRTR